MLSNQQRTRIRAILATVSRNPLVADDAIRRLGVVLRDVDDDVAERIAHVHGRRVQFNRDVTDAALAAIAGYLQDCGVSSYDVFPEQDKRPATAQQHRTLYRLFGRSAKLTFSQAAAIFRLRDETLWDLGFDWYVEQVGGSNGRYGKCDDRGELDAGSANQVLAVGGPGDGLFGSGEQQVQGQGTGQLL